MNVLLDPHLLGGLADDPALGEEARLAISNPASIVHVSAASLWEISILRALEKLEP